jgi:predicted metal-binding membrane protein
MAPPTVPRATRSSIDIPGIEDQANAGFSRPELLRSAEPRPAHRWWRLMDSASLRRAPPHPGLIQAGLLGLLLALAALAWAITNEQMAGMDAGPGTDPGALGFFLGVWVVMMAAMMFPSIAPMVLMYARMQEGGREAVAGATTLFVAGYLVAWTAAGLAGYGVFEIGRSLSGDAFSWQSGGRFLAGAVVLAAAVYQLTPLKDICLRHCRSPFGFLIAYWKPGRLGALRMGAIHGAWCIGCCWALMAALFALGVMSLGWMALIAVLIAVEKLLPRRDLANRAVALVLLALGITLATSPASVPGLTIPGSPKAMRAMERMDGGSRGSMGSGSTGSAGGESMGSRPMKSIGARSTGAGGMPAR